MMNFLAIALCYDIMEKDKQSLDSLMKDTNSLAVVIMNF